MNINASFPSRYLKAANIPQENPVTVRIDRVEQEDVGEKGKKELKPVLYFIGKEKGMVLNKTNAKTLTNAYGEETDDWHGKAITIISTETEYAGDMVPCLRLRLPKPTAPANGGGGGQAAPVANRREEIRNRAPAQSPVSEDQEFASEEIPFAWDGRKTEPL